MMMLADSAGFEVWIATRVFTSVEHVQHQQLVSQFARILITWASVFTGSPQSADHQSALSTAGNNSNTQVQLYIQAQGVSKDGKGKEDRSSFFETP